MGTFGSFGPFGTGPRRQRRQNRTVRDKIFIFTVSHITIISPQPKGNKQNRAGITGASLASERASWTESDSDFISELPARRGNDRYSTVVKLR